eukprot:gene26941-33127_t
MASITATSNTASRAGGTFYLGSSTSFELANASVTDSFSADGGVFSVENSNATVNSSFIYDNRAGNAAGVLDTDASNVVFINCTFWNNHAMYYSGGVLNALRSSVAFQQVEVKHSTAALFGGHFHLLGSTLTIHDIRMEDGLAMYEGGCISAVEGSAVHLYGVYLSNCSTPYGRGGGLYLLESTLYSDAADIRDSSSENGAGLAVVSGSDAFLNNTLISENVASNAGGGIFVSASTCRIDNCTLSDNVAQVDGGGIFIERNASTVSMTRVNISGNQATQAGGGMALALEDTLSEVEYLSNATELAMEELQFAENHGISSNCFWEWTEAREIPQCANCSSSTPEPVLRSSPVRFEVHRRGEEASVMANVSSGEMDPDPITYLAIDAYEQVAVADSSVSIYASNATDGLLLSGQTGVLYLDSGAIFTDLVLTGTPGKSYTFVLRPEGSNWAPIELRLELLPCRAGEVHTEKGMCRGCEENYLKFDNSSTECVSCEGYDGILCQGGSSYQINQGHWVAPNAKYCSSDANEDSAEQCLVRLPTGGMRVAGGLPNWTLGCIATSAATEALYKLPCCATSLILTSGGLEGWTNYGELRLVGAAGK